MTKAGPKMSGEVHNTDGPRRENVLAREGGEEPHTPAPPLKQNQKPQKKTRVGKGGPLICGRKDWGQGSFERQPLAACSTAGAEGGEKERRIF